MCENKCPDVCSLDCLYNSTSYNHYLPQRTLEAYRSGLAFESQSEYAPEEIEALDADIREIYTGIMAKNPERNKSIILTAGPPGAGKTTLLHKEIKRQQMFGRNYAYVCPDEVLLKNQKRTYQREMAAVDSTDTDASQELFKKWKPASIYGREVILGRFIEQGVSFYNGTTATSPDTIAFLSFLKRKGYHIKLLHISTQDCVRRLSVDERNKDFVHASKKEMNEKALLFPQRIMDCYLKFADEIEFYYRSGPRKDAVHAATWHRNPHQPSVGDMHIDGDMHIKDVEAYNSVKRLHNQKCATLKRDDLRWEETVEKVTSTYFTTPVCVNE